MGEDTKVLKRHAATRRTLKPAAAVHVTKSTLAIQALRDAILRGDIRQGDHLTVSEISEQLGMSPTPVREAIRTLQAEGLITQSPHHSLSVKRYTPKDVGDIFLLRSTLESLAVRLAVPHLTADAFARLDALMDEMREASTSGDYERMYRCNADWHLAIYSAADNRILLDVILGLWQKFLWEVIWMMPGHADRSLQQHEAIMAACRRQDADAAARLMYEHIQHGEESAIEHLQGQNDAAE
jgi:DNA-binding GntR family transcriptional regulator